MNPPKTLWSIVNEAKSDLDAVNTKHDLKYFHWAIRGFRELNNYGLVLPSGRTVQLEIAADNTVKLPSDFLEIYKLGICRDGYIINFDINDNICLYDADPCSCDEIENALNVSSPLNNWWWNWRSYYLGYVDHNQYVGGLYGYGAGFYRGGYRIDHERGIIKFDDVVKEDKVILEYKTDGGLSDEGNAFVPQILIRPMTNFVHRERCTFESENMNNINRAQFLAAQAVKFGRRYVKGVKAAVQNMKSMSTDDLLATWRASIMQIPKR